MPESRRRGWPWIRNSGPLIPSGRERVPVELDPEIQTLARLEARRLGDAIEAAVREAPSRRIGKVSSNTKWEGKPIPHQTFWELFRLAVEDGASARRLVELTDDRRNDLAFVNRNKAGDIVKWVKAHPTLARRAVDRHELPRAFRATSDGVFTPKL